MKRSKGVPDATGSKAPNFSYEKQRKYVFRAESAQEILRPYAHPLNLFMGIHSCLLPSYFCLLKEAFDTVNLSDILGWFKPQRLLYLTQVRTAIILYSLLSQTKLYLD